MSAPAISARDAADLIADVVYRITKESDHLPFVLTKEDREEITEIVERVDPSYAAAERLAKRHDESCPTCKGPSQ